MKTIDIMIDELVQEIKKQEEDIAKWSRELDKIRKGGRELWKSQYLDELIGREGARINDNYRKIGKLIYEQKIKKEV